MSRALRTAVGGLAYHVLNRAVGRRTLFHTTRDYAAFVDAVAETLRARSMRICGYCVMPNHWHMVLWPEHDGDLSVFVQYLTNLHVKRWKWSHHEIGEGHLYQGRFKSFPIQTEAYFHTAMRYVERNPLRAQLVTRAEEWPWSSLGQVTTAEPIPLSVWPIHEQSHHRTSHWIQCVNSPQTEGELSALRTCIRRGRPFGSEPWVENTAKRLHLDLTLRPRGRPRKKPSLPSQPDVANVLR